MRPGWYTIEVTFAHGQETKIYRLTNCGLDRIAKFREIVFTSGFMYTAPECADSADPDHFIVINPLKILSIDIWKQAKKF